MRRGKDALSELIERWARWLAADGPEGSGPGAGGSVLARWMDCKGDMIWGSGRPIQGPQESIERRVELVLYELAKRDQLAVDVLRLEYGARWSEVAHRRGWKGYRGPQGKTQFDHALLLGVSLRTYKGRLAMVRAKIQEKLGVEA